jgi:hypothetical protein
MVLRATAWKMCRSEIVTIVVIWHNSLQYFDYLSAFFIFTICHVTYYVEFQKNSFSKFVLNLNFVFNLIKT